MADPSNDAGQVIGAVDQAITVAEKHGINGDLLTAILVIAIVLVLAVGLIIGIPWLQRKAAANETSKSHETEPTARHHAADEHSLVSLFDTLGKKVEAGLDKVESRLTAAINDVKTDVAKLETRIDHNDEKRGGQITTLFAQDIATTEHVHAVELGLTEIKAIVGLRKPGRATA